MTAEVSYVEGKRHLYFRFWNAFGRLSGDREFPWTVIDGEKVIEKAIRKEKWDDFGSDDFREPMRVMLKGIQEEGHLNYVGRVSIHMVLYGLLRNRLRRNRAVTDHPEILDQPVKRPLIIAGAPRTGTTLLNQLLSQDPGARPLLGWEALRPAPIRRSQERGEIPRSMLRAMAFNEWVFKRVNPELTEMHSYSYDKPDECHWLLFPSFMWTPGLVMPTVREWLWNQPEETYDKAYADYRLGLQILEWQRPARDHWVLKSPVHLWALGSLLKVVPEAHIIQTHRRLEEVIPSFCSLVGAMLNVVSDGVKAGEMGKPAMEIAGMVIERFTDARQKCDARRITDVRYQDLTRDPIGVIRSIYDTFGYEYTPAYEERLQKYLAEDGKSGVARHKYTLEQFGLDADEIGEKFKAYHSTYGLEGTP